MIQFDAEIDIERARHELQAGATVIRGMEYPYATPGMYMDVFEEIDQPSDVSGAELILGTRDCYVVATQYHDERFLGMGEEIMRELQRQGLFEVYESPTHIGGDEPNKFYFFCSAPGTGEHEFISTVEQDRSLQISKVLHGQGSVDAAGIGKVDFNEGDVLLVVGGNEVQHTSSDPEGRIIAVWHPGYSVL